MKVVSKHLGLAGFLRLAILIYFASGTALCAATIEEVSFASKVVSDRSSNRTVEVKAKLYLPDPSQFPLAAVVITPSSSGVEKGREVYYAQELLRAGIAALVVDSFRSRGLTESIFDQRLLSEWETADDAVAGLRWLVADSRFRRDRIGIMGVSKGGTVARDTALEARRKLIGMTDIAFAAHIPISPDCTWINRSTETTGAPMFFMLAELDDQTPAAPCLDYVERLQKAGNSRIEARVYYGAHHAWEELGDKPEFVPLAENYSRCRVWIEDDGSMVAADDGARIPEDGWHRWAKKTCMSLGAHCCGGSRELKRRATEDLIAFLKKYGF